ncbi:MAG: DUF2784 domain-containing protein [Moraxellaceae bacterium]|nr:DUF2784 domain-containing protein [Moraxellaceae bacterium]
MMRRLAAHTVALLHFSFIALAFLGGLLLWSWPAVRWVHLPVLMWAVLIAVIGWTCPLTPLENRLRAAGGLQPYDGGFIEHYITARWYPDGLPRRVLAALGLLLLAINIAAYGLWWQHAQ